MNSSESFNSTIAAVPPANGGLLLSFLGYCVLTSIIITHLLIFFSSVVIPLYYIIRKRDGLYMFDTTIRTVFFIMVLYVLVVASNLYQQGMTLTDYVNMIVNFSRIDTVNTLEVVFFFVILSGDSIGLLLMYLTNQCSKINCLSRSQELPLPLYAASSDVSDTDPVIAQDSAENEHAFIIVCHNSTDKIEETLESMRAKIPGDNVFVSDNGSSLDESRATRVICQRYRVHYLYLSVGSKTVSQFATANTILKTHPHIKYVSLIDDDTHLPATWSFRHMKQHFEPANIRCIAVPLCVKNRINFITECQNLEYLLAGYSRSMHAKLGGTMFGSGAFSVWELRYFVEICSRHNTQFNGEDFQLGIILHAIHNKQFRTQDYTEHQCPTIGVCEHIVVPTIVPYHWWHLSDLPLIGHVFHHCECGENSLSRQRGRGWDVTRHNFFLFYFRVLFSHSKLSRIWIKLLFINEIYLVLSDWGGLFYLFFFGFIGGEWSQIFRSLFIVICWNIPLLFIIAQTLLRKYEIPFIIQILFPIFYKLPMNTIIKIDSMFYNFFIYSAIKAPPAIWKRLQQDRAFKQTIDDYVAHYSSPNCDLDDDDDDQVVRIRRRPRRLIYINTPAEVTPSEIEVEVQVPSIPISTPSSRTVLSNNYIANTPS